MDKLCLERISNRLALGDSAGLLFCRAREFLSRFWLSTCLGLFAGVPGLAHTTGISYGEIQIGTKEVEVRLQVNVRELQFVAELDANHDRQLAADELESELKRFAPELLKHYRIGTDREEGKGTLQKVSFRAPSGEVECRLSYSFQEPLREVWVRAALHRLTDSGHWHLAQVRYDGQEEQCTFNLENPEVRIDLWRGWSSHWNLGGKFLSLAGRDLVANPEIAGFLLGLGMVRGATDGAFVLPLLFLLSQAVAFGIGSRLGPVFPPGFSGAAMALSVMYVASENLLLKEITQRGWLAVLFGSIFGIAFSELVQKAGLPTKGTLTALVGYQLGILLGIAGVAGLTLLFVEAFKRLPRPRQGIAVTSLAFMALGLVQFARRIL